MIAINDYKLIKKIGEGSFGEVYLTVKGNNPKQYAAKRLSLIKTNHPTFKKYLQNEIIIMKEMNHQNIVHLYDLFVTKTHYYFIMDYCNGGSLNDLLSDYKLKFGKPFSQEIIQYLMIQIVDGLKYIHSLKIIHRDLKLDNILVHFDNPADKYKLNILTCKIKIIDFGLVTKLTPNKLAETAAGSPIYMDPTILKKYNRAGGYEKLQGYNEKADIWSLGIICYQMLTGNTLFNVDNLEQLIQKVEEGNYSIPLDFALSKEIISFLNLMLQYNSDIRASAEDLSKHDFLTKNIKYFQKVDFNKISKKISGKELVINYKDNDTIYRLFNRNTVKNEENDKNDNLMKGNVINNNFLNGRLNKNYKNYNGNIQINIGATRRMSLKGQGQAQGQGSFERKETRLCEGLISPKRRYRKDYFIKKDENKLKELEGIKNSVLNLEKQEEQERCQKQKDNHINENIEDLQKGKGKKEWRTYINALLDEYKSAKEYFEKNNLKSQEKDANDKYLKIQNIKSQYELGYSMYIANLPEPITPEYIYGYPKLERDKKFQEILLKYQNHRNKLINKIKSHQKYAITNNMKQEYEKEKSKLESLNHYIEIIEKKFRSEWAPAPEYKKEIQKIQVEKRSYENCEFILKIKIKKTDGKQNNSHFIISLRVSELKKLQKDIHLTREGNYCQECIWNISANDWINIDNNVDTFIFEIEPFQNSFIRFNKIIVNIGQVKKGKGISFIAKIPIENNDRIAVNFSITPIIPKGKKYYQTEDKQYLIIKRIYPEFKGKSLLTYDKPNVPFY